jgi:hypothetical protein
VRRSSAIRPDSVLASSAGGSFRISSTNSGGAPWIAASENLPSSSLNAIA